ncbi:MULTISPECIES: hypothetical protein [Acinetobacter]|uniref:hypothetical protein n=1 Tax=Acinetobacter TaxID=469 RepID=UPI0012DB4876|nr:MULTISPECIES: hypothetical protein [Acinetobacter]MBC9229841.1 hypothetical protein [Acinetobacter baumannii]MDF2418163.1 hypothetical protein [Acinetobacter beijerinckii]UTO19181.1 hypothetical protein NGC85_14870 [Acinetobacter sp. Z1]
MLTRKYDRSANWRDHGLKLYYPKRLQAQEYGLCLAIKNTHGSTESQYYGCHP